MRNHLRVYWKRYLAAKALALLGVLVLYLLGVFTTHAETWIKTKVGGPHGTPTVVVTVPKTAVTAAGAALTDHKGSRDETPAGAPPAALTAARAQDAALAANDRLPKVFPDAAPEQRGCLTRLVRNYSSRNGVAPRAFFLHYTVSRNLAGWVDDNAILSIFDTAAYQASSNYIFDREGHCYYIVRETDKAWTQAAFNPVGISVEIVDTGYERTLLPAPARRELAMIISDALYRWKIPVQLGAASNGRLTRPGILDHEMLGPAGGGHHDVAPRVGNGFNVAAGLARVKQVVADVRAYRASVAAAGHKAQLRQARAAVQALRRHGASWATIFKTPVWARFKALGGT